MKKSILFLFIGLFLISNVFGIDNVNEDSVDNIRGDLEEGKEKIDKAKELTDKEKWEYLGDQWKELLLQEGKPLYYIDGFFQEISFVFMIMLGEPYSFSIILFFVFILWLYLFLEVSKIMKLFFSMTGFIPYGIGFAVVSLIGQTGTLRFAIEFFGDLLAKLTTLFFFIALFVIFFSLGFFGRIIGKVGEAYQRQLEKAKKEQAEWDRKKIHMFADAITEGLKESFGR